MIKKTLVSWFILCLISLGVSASFIHEFKASEGLYKVLINADTLDKLNIKPTKFGFLNEEKVLVFDIECEYVSSFHNGYAKVRKNGKYGFIDKTGKYVIEPTYISSSEFAEGKILVGDSINRFDKIIDITNTLILKLENPFRFISKSHHDSLSNGMFLNSDSYHKYRFSENLINVENSFLNTSGNLVFVTIGDARDCKNGMIAYAIKIGEPAVLKYGFYDQTGFLKIPAKYDSVEDYTKESAVVGKKLPSQKYYEINKEGKILKFVDHTSQTYYFD
jgi:hypothetical protein